MSQNTVRRVAILGSSHIPLHVQIPPTLKRLILTCWQHLDGF
nr:hypothetical protein [Acinetobacter baumannii]